jgi:hypothetical protein
MSVALCGAGYLFSILQSVFVQQPTGSRVCLSPLIRAALSDWSHLASTIADHPIPITTLVPRAPHFVGSVDASKSGVGGFWLPTCFGTGKPSAFHLPFHSTLSNRLVSVDNPNGILTINDFELAALTLATALVAHYSTTPHASLWLGNDNSSAVSWTRRGSTSTTGPNAHLLRWLAQIARQHDVCLKYILVPGDTNTIADFCSRSFHLMDSQFLQELNSRFPTDTSWQLVHPTPNMTLKMSCA